MTEQQVLKSSPSHPVNCLLLQEAPPGLFFPSPTPFPEQHETEAVFMARKQVYSTCCLIAAPGLPSWGKGPLEGLRLGQGRSHGREGLLGFFSCHLGLQSLGPLAGQSPQPFDILG